MRVLAPGLSSWLRIILSVAGGIGAASAQPFAYLSNQMGNNVSVVNRANNTLVTTIPYSAGGLSGLAITPDGSTLYVTSQSKGLVVLMSTATNSMTGTIPVGVAPVQVAVTPNGAAAYVVNSTSNTVSAINTVSKSVTGTIPVGVKPVGLAISPDGATVLVTNLTSNNVSVISTSSNNVSTTWQGLSGPSAAAVSPNGNVAYVANQYGNTVTVHSIPSGSLITTINGFAAPNALAFTPDGRYIYVTNANGQTVSVVDTISNLIVSTIPVGLLPTAVAVSPDASTVYVTNGYGYSLSVINAATRTVTTTLAKVGIFPFSIVLSVPPAAASIVKTAGDGQSVLLGQAFPVRLQVKLTDGSGNPVAGASVSFAVNPGANGASGTFSSTPPMPVLTDQNGFATAPVLTPNGIAGPFTVTASANALSNTFTLTSVAPSYMLGSGSMAVGAGAGQGSVLLASNAPWTAGSNASWLHVTAGSGSGSAAIRFSYDANSNPGARTGTLTVAGLPFSVSQAGTAYLPVNIATVLTDSDLNNPQGVAVDQLGNVYIADTGNNEIKQWNASSQQVVTLNCPGLSAPAAVALDAQGSLYVAESGNNDVRVCNAATGQMIPLVSAGLSGPTGVGLDVQGNVYVADTGNNAIKEWNATSQQVSTLASQGLNGPSGIAADVQGNVYVGNSGNHSIGQWNAASHQMLALISSGLDTPGGTAVDGQGNVYIADKTSNAVMMWNAATQQMSALINSGLSNPTGVAVDSLGSLYVADTGNGAIRKYTPGYLAVATGNLNEGAVGGSDSIPVQVLPAGMPLYAVSDSPWLSITSLVAGSVNFSFQPNTSAISRTAVITVLGVPVTVVQTGAVAASLLKISGDAQNAGLGQQFPAPLQVMVTDAGGIPIPGATVEFDVIPGSSGAAATFGQVSSTTIATDQYGYATAPPLTANNAGGVFTVIAGVNGSSVQFTLTNVVNTLGGSSAIVGSPAGTDTIILGAVGSWNATSNALWLHLSNSSGAGNALVSYSFDTNPDAPSRVGTLTVAGLTFTVTQAGQGSSSVNAVTRLAISGLKNPQGVAVDGQGNIYIVDTGHNAVKKWNPATQQLGTLISAGLNGPSNIAVDTQGNIYVADKRNNAIKLWTAANGQVTTLVGSGLNAPYGVAVDGQGNVYFSDTGNNAIKKWIAASQQVQTLISSGVSGPQGVALDALGNVYFAETGSKTVKEWTAADQTVAQVVSSGLNNPVGIAVDGKGNIYITDTGDNTLKQWSAGSRQLSTLVSSGLTTPNEVAVDAQGNLYVANSAGNSIVEAAFTYLSLSPTSQTVAAQAGSGSVSVQMLPAGIPWTAASDQSWLKISSTSGGAAGFTFTANTNASSRVAHITVLGQQVNVSQNGDTAATVTKTAGTNQTVVAGTLFLTNMQVRVLDAAGKPVVGAPVTFTVVPGASGATATFSTTPPMPILTNSTGYATAPALTAGAIAGNFTVKAGAGALNTSFSLKILAQ